MWFAVDHAAGAPWVLTEILGVVVYGAVGYRGLRGSLMWLAARWALHPLWDIPLHFIGPGAAFAPEPYAISCLTFDLAVAAAITVAAALGTRRAAGPVVHPGASASAAR